jgi:hypothetical protein
LFNLPNAKPITTVDAVIIDTKVYSRGGACNDQLIIKVYVLQLVASNTERKMGSPSDPKVTKARWSSTEQWATKIWGSYPVWNLRAERLGQRRYHGNDSQDELINVSQKQPTRVQGGGPFVRWEKGEWSQKRASDAQARRRERAKALRMESRDSEIVLADGVVGVVVVGARG